MKGFFFSLIPATIGFVWFAGVILLVFLTVTVFTGGHPPFAIFPLAANIIGAVLVYPFCVIFSGIGLIIFDADDQKSFNFSSRYPAGILLLFFILEIKFHLTYEMSYPVLIILTYLYPVFFFRDGLMKRRIKSLLWVGLCTLLLSVSLNHVSCQLRSLLLLSALLINLCCLINPWIESSVTAYRPKILCKRTLIALVIIELISIPAALLIR